MSSSSEANWELTRLIDAYFDDRLDDRGWDMLRARLKAGRSARDAFREMLELHAALVGDSMIAGKTLAASDVAKLKNQGNDRRSRRQAAVMMTGIAATVLVAIGLYVIALGAQPVTVQTTAGAVFRSEAVSAGQHLDHRDVELESGLIELAFPVCEASVCIEAPARFRVIDDQTLFLKSGCLTADVKNGDVYNLRVLTPDSDVLDLGTRFAVDVVAGRGSEVHVFEGEVSAAAREEEGRGQRRALHQGDAIRVATAGGIDDRQLRRAAFIHSGELRQLTEGWTQARQNQWLAARAKLRQDPAILAWVDFEKDNPVKPADIHGARVVQGRFPGSRAMEFLDEGDHIQLNLNATTRQLTMMAWLRLDHVADELNSIYHTDHWDTIGQVHWLVVGGKQMRFSLFGQSFVPGGRWPESKRTMIEDLGRWVHLASVYDADQRAIRFFIDGELDSQVKLDVAPTAVLGPAQIGNWKSYKAKQEDRRLSGRLDDLIFLSRVLSDDEVGAWYRAGNPY